MKKILLAGVAALGLAGTASAADLAVAPIAYVPVFTWTGCYLGANGGWIGGQDKYSYQSFVQGEISGAPISAAFDPYSHSSDASGGTFGGQFGCQYQMGSLVLGGEWDWNWSGLKEDSTTSLYGGELGFVGNSDHTWSQTTHKQLDWFSTARVRLGWAAWDRFLVYATGGVALGALDAYTHDIFDINVTDGCSYLPRSGPNNCGFGAYHENRIGWTVGGGFEWAFANNWTAKAEVLYLDFGSLDYISPHANNPTSVEPSIVRVNGLDVSAHRFTSIDAKEIVARVGVNYLFHLGPDPAVARY